MSNPCSNGCQHGFECPICLESLNSPADVGAYQPRVPNAIPVRNMLLGTHNPPATTFRFGTETNPDPPAATTFRFGTVTNPDPPTATFSFATLGPNPQVGVFGAPNVPYSPRYGPVPNLNAPSSGAVERPFSFSPTNNSGSCTPGNPQRATASTPPAPTDICATACGHMFHTACLEKWFRDNATRDCPNCRKVVYPFQITHLYPNPLPKQTSVTRAEFPTLNDRMDSLKRDQDKLAEKIKKLEARRPNKRSYVDGKKHATTTKICTTLEELIEQLKKKRGSNESDQDTDTDDETPTKKERSSGEEE